MRLLPVVLLTGCELIGAAVPCPSGPLSEGDLPCTCQGVLVESLSCGQIACEASGLVFGPTVDTADCTTTTTFTDSGTTP